MPQLLFKLRLFLLVIVAGVIFFKETIRLRQLVGIAIAIIGFYLFYLDRSGNAVNNFELFRPQMSGYYSQLLYGLCI